MRQFEKKIYIGMILLAAGFIPLIAASFLSVSKVVNAQNDMITSNVQELILAERLRYLDSSMSSLMPIYVLTGEPSLVVEFDQRYQQFKDLTAQLLGKEADKYSREIIREIQKSAERRYQAASPVIQIKKSGASLREVRDFLESNSGNLGQNLQDKLYALVIRESEDMAQARKDLSTTVNWVVTSLIVLGCLSILLFGYIGWQMIKAIQQKNSYDEAQLRLLQQERALSQARKETVEVVSHDLKSPLGSIRMCVELMIEDTAGVPQFTGFQEDLQLIHRSAISMENLIKDLLDHSKIEAGQLVLEKSDCDLIALTRELVKRFEPQARAKNLKLSAQYQTAQMRSHCDTGRIEQVLSNLLSNAIKFTPPEGEVIIVIRSQGDNEVLVSVTDNGPGIEAQQLPHIFERFWQVRETSKQGTGLGLAIAKAIVDAHKGRIWVESTPAKGSVFYFTLPALPATRSAVSQISI